MGRGNIQQRWRTATCLPVLLLSSACTVFGSSDYSLHRQVVKQEPEVVAWALAEACRDLMPGSDANPAHGNPLILQSRPGEFIIHYSCPQGGPYRVAANGRLSPPRLALSEDGLDYIPGEFLPLSQESGCGGAASSLLLEIRDHREGSLVVIEMRGGADLQRAAHDRIEDTLLLLNAIAASKELAKIGAWLQLRDLLDQIEADLHARPASRACKMAAPLHWYRSLAHQRLGAELAARADLSNCLDLDPSLLSIRAKLLHLDDRLNKSPEALRNLHTLANDGSLGIAGSLLLNRFNRLRRKAEAVHYSDLSGMTARVALALDHGDLPSARSWLDRCIGEASGAERSDELWNLKVRLMRANGFFRSAFSAGLAMGKEASMTDPKTLLETCLDGLELGDPSLGLRLLARHWTELHQRQPRMSEGILERILAVMDPLLVARILAMEHPEAITDGALNSLLDASGLAPRGRRLLAQLRKLRHTNAAKNSATIGFGNSPGFENAPGVAPVR